MVAVKPTNLHTEREILQGKFAAFITNPTLRERENLDEALNHYEREIERRSNHD